MKRIGSTLCGAPNSGATLPSAVGVALPACRYPYSSATLASSSVLAEKAGMPAPPLRTCCMNAASLPWYANRSGNGAALPGT